MKNFVLKDFLIECMNIDSTTGNEGEFGDFLANFMRSAGWNVKEQVVAMGRKNLLIFQKAVSDIEVVFCSHLDTVPPYFPPSIVEETVRGRGSNDAKGQISAMIQMAFDLQKNHQTVVEKIGLLFTVGEEINNCGMRKVNDIEDLNPNFLIIGEPTENKLGTIQKGGLKIHLEVNGKPGHSSYPHTGESANHKMVEILADITNYSWPKNEAGETTFNIGYLKGGEWDFAATWTQKAEAIVFFRTVTENDLIVDQLEQLINGRAKIEYLVAVEPEHLHPRPEELADVPVASIPFTTDLCHFHRRDNFKGAFVYGAGSALTAHSDEESVSLADLKKAVDVYRRLALYTCRRNDS